MKMERIKKEDLKAFWPLAAKILEKAFKPNQIYTLADIHSALEKEEAQLWCIFNENEVIGSLVTSIDAASKGRICNILKLAGIKFKAWAKLMETTLNDFAKMHECINIEALTRSGFSRVLPSFKKQRDVLLIRKVI